MLCNRVLTCFRQIWPHAAFIWAQQDYEQGEKPPENPRYGDLDRFRRYNLYYLKIDLPTGKVYNLAGKELDTPVRKSIADVECLVWDTDWRISPVPPWHWTQSYITWLTNSPQ